MAKNESVMPAATSSGRFSDSGISPNSLQGGTSILNPFLPTSTEALGKAVQFFNPSIVYSFSKGTNLTDQNGDNADSTIQQLSPSISIVAAERVRFRYSPSFIWYSSTLMQDRVDHSASASAGTAVGSTDLNLGIGYSVTSFPLIETGRQTKQEVSSISGTAGVALGDRSGLDVTVGWYARTTDLYTDVHSLTAFVWYRRDIGQSLRLSAGVGGTGSRVDPGDDLSSRQAKLGVRWLPSSKLTMSLDVGIDESSFEGSERNERSPVYSGGLSYKITELTSVVFDVQRQVSAAYFANMLNQNERYSLGLSQRLLGVLYLGASVSWQKARYAFKDVPAGITEREDEYQSVSASLSTRLFQRISAGLNWSRGRNLSNITEFKRTSTILGINLGWQY